MQVENPQIDLQADTVPPGNKAKSSEKRKSMAKSTTAYGPMNTFRVRQTSQIHMEMHNKSHVYFILS